MVTEGEMRRLTFIKYLYGIGVEQSREHQPRAAVSILTLHDSVELFLQLALEYLKAAPKGNRVNTFEEYFKLLESPSVGIMLAGKIAMLRLNTTRNGLKHHANLPASDTISELQGRVGGFLEDNTLAIFGIGFADVSMLSLIRFDNTRTSLSEAEDLVGGGQYKEALGPIALAFHHLVRDYSNSTRERFGRSSLDFGWMPMISSSFALREKDPKLAKITDELAKVAEVVKNLRDTVRTLSLGLDNRAYQRFQALTPLVLEAMGGSTTVVPKREEPPTSDECRFCFDFVVESALRLQEFDF